MTGKRPFLAETLTVIGLIAAPFVLPHLGFSPTTINRILIWGLFGLGFDLLFGYAGLLSFGQSAFFGTGGMFAAYLLTAVNFPYVLTSIVIGAIVAGAVGFLVGLIALRRTGIYFAMITVAIAEVFFFIEFNPLSDFTGGENGLPGVPTPSFNLGFTKLRFDSDWSMYVFLAFWYFVGLAIALRIVRSPVGAILSALRDNPLRASALGHNIHGYKLTPSWSRPHMPDLPAASSPSCKASCRRTLSCSTRPASSSCRPRSAGREPSSGRWSARPYGYISATSSRTLCILARPGGSCSAWC